MITLFWPICWIRVWRKRGGPPEDLATAWTVEIDRRIAAYEAGESQAVDAETAMKEMRAKLAEHRNRTEVWEDTDEG